MERGLQCREHEATGKRGERNSFLETPGLSRMETTKKSLRFLCRSAVNFSLICLMRTK